MFVDDEAITKRWDGIFNPSRVKEYNPFADFGIILLFIGFSLCLTTILDNAAKKFQYPLLIGFFTVYLLYNALSNRIGEKAKRNSSLAATPLAILLISLQNYWYIIAGLFFISSFPRVAVNDQGFLPSEYPLNIISLLNISYIILVVFLVYQTVVRNQELSSILLTRGQFHLFRKFKSFLILIPPAAATYFIALNAGIIGEVLPVLLAFELILVLFGIQYGFELINPVQLIFLGLDRSPFYGKTLNQALKEYKARQKKLVKSEPAEIYAWCPVCDKPAYTSTKGSINDPAFLVCAECKTELSSLWCEDCQVGGDYIEGIENRPDHWVCPSCNTRYPLPPDFYKNPLRVFIDHSYKK